MVDVRADDAASLATAESLITAPASNGHIVDEVMWTIGLARWLPEGGADRARLMARAGDLIDEHGIGGLARFLDPEHRTPSDPGYHRRAASIPGRCNVVTKKERLERLGSVRLFAGLNKADLKYLLDISRIVYHDEGHTIIHEGDRGAGFQLILDGEARVVRGGRTAVRLGPGEFFGEMALIDEGPRTATVIAITPMTTLGIAAWDFRALVKSRPEMAWRLLVHMTGRLREAQKREDMLRA